MYNKLRSHLNDQVTLGPELGWTSAHYTAALRTAFIQAPLTGQPWFIADRVTHRSSHSPCNVLAPCTFSISMHHAKQDLSAGDQNLLTRLYALMHKDAALCGRVPKSDLADPQVTGLA